MTIIPHTELFTRHPANPIITSAHLPYAANTVFNPGATICNGETILLLRVEDRRGLVTPHGGAQRGWCRGMADRGRSEFRGGP